MRDRLPQNLQIPERLERLTPNLSKPLFMLGSAHSHGSSTSFADQFKRSETKDTMDQHHPSPAQFIIEATAAESMAKSLKLPSVLHLLPHLIHSAKALARPPISNYHVGAVGLGSDGRIFIGVNLEFPGIPLHHSVHAEQFLLTNLAVHRCSGLIAFAVSSAPCGHCRQFLQELRQSSSLKILVLDGQDSASQNLNGVENIGPNAPDFKPLSSFLPHPFGPRDLLGEEIPLLLEQHDNELRILPMTRSNAIESVVSNGNCGKYEKSETLLSKAAMEAANNSHAPYSGCPSGVALMDCEGNVYKGSYVESAAYNPSLGPVQGALVAYLARGGTGYERIVAAVLVEKEEAKIRQEDTARMLLKAVSPKCELRVFYCHLA